MRSLKEVIHELEKIRDLGYITTHRPDDTGIGKTLEDLLGIKENNIRLPDIGDIELKAKRIESGSMLTLASKSPMPPKVNRTLWKNYSYLCPDGYCRLHNTVYGSRYNDKGFKISFSDEVIGIFGNEGALILENSKGIPAYYPMEIFDDVLKSKSNKLLLVFAETKGKRKTTSEAFHYIEAYLLANLSKKKFKEAIEKDVLKVDIRIGVYLSGPKKGTYHDHGTGFRINVKNIPLLYDEYDCVLKRQMEQNSFINSL